VTGIVVRKDTGGAYVAVFALEVMIVPREEFPRTIPFTSQTVGAFVVPETTA
jgi:hypothetical protein